MELILRTIKEGMKNRVNLPSLCLGGAEPLPCPPRSIRRRMFYFRNKIKLSISHLAPSDPVMGFLCTSKCDIIESPHTFDVQLFFDANRKCLNQRMTWREGNRNIHGQRGLVVGTWFRGEQLWYQKLEHRLSCQTKLWSEKVRVTQGISILNFIFFPRKI